MSVSIKIRDYDLFLNSVKALEKMTNAAKFSLNETGLTVYGKNAFARGEFTTNSVYADGSVDFCLDDIGMFLKVLATVGEIHNGDFSDLKFVVDLPFIKVESKKFKTKITLSKEEVVAQFISQKVTTPLKPVLEFTTSSDQIKYINNHSFIFKDLDMARVYLAVNPEMENNVIYATIGNNSNDMNNSITLKFGLVNSGSMDGRQIILNFDRLNLFNIVQADSIKIELMDKNVLVNKIHQTGKNDSYFDFTIYNSMLAS